jgi:hypothetical protein
MAAWGSAAEGRLAQAREKVGSAHAHALSLSHTHKHMRARSLSLTHTHKRWRSSSLRDRSSVAAGNHMRALSLSLSLSLTYKRWRSSSLRDRPSAAAGVCCDTPARIPPPPRIVYTPDFSLKQIARNFGQTRCPKPVQQSGGSKSKSPLR